jgi:cyclic pyranopterin phosphate synthase
MTLKSKYLRLSVTNQCNLSCYFCHREGQKGIIGNFLTPDDIKFVIQQCLDLGFNKFKLTGGEPLLRKEILSIVSIIGEFNLSNFSMITNGVLLKEYANKLRQAGLPRLNVTLPTLNKKVFERTIDKNTEKLDLIIQGIDKAIAEGYTDLKLNFVYHSEVNKKDIDDLIQFASDRNLTIVLLPVLLHNPRAYDKKLSANDVCNYLFSDKIAKEVDFSEDDGIKKRMIYLYNGVRILIRLNEVSDINPFGECTFCRKKSQCCEGIFPVRILSDGNLLPCLEEGVQRIDMRDVIINRKDAKFKKIMYSIIGDNNVYSN